MDSSYVQKLKTNNYSIGSFDYYQKLSKELIKKNSNLTFEERQKRFLERTGANKEKLTEIKKLLPNAYICNLDGKVIIGNNKEEII